MPARAPIIVNDGQSTPAAHTFSPKGGTATLTKFVSPLGVTAAGWETISHEIAEPAGTRSTFKAEIGVYFPVEELVDGVPTVVESSSGKLTMNFPTNSTADERKNALAMIRNWLANADVEESIVQLEPFY